MCDNALDNNISMVRFAGVFVNIVKLYINDVRGIMLLTTIHHTATTLHRAVLFLIPHTYHIVWFGHMGYIQHQGVTSPFRSESHTIHKKAVWLLCPK